MDAIDLTAYRARIGWKSDHVAGLRALTRLLQAHMAAIPFENCDVLLGRGVRLDLPSLQRKLVDDRRGGYCFEHATLLAAALEQLGYALVRHTARVVLVTPRTHMFIVVTLGDRRYVLDPGFGALAPRVPVPLDESIAAGEHGDTHWMQREGGHWTLRTKVDGADTDCWVTALEEDNAADFAMGNYYTSTHPGSAFVERIMLRALTPQGRVSLMNRDLTIRENGRSTRSQVRDRAQLRELVRDFCGFDLPALETLRVPSIPEWT